MRERELRRRAPLTWFAGVAMALSLGTGASAQRVGPSPEAPGLRFLSDSSAALASTRADRLYLRQGVVDASQPGLGVAQLAGLGQDSHQRAILQLDGPMSPQRRRALRLAGVRIEGFIPANAFIVSLDDADSAALGALGFVRWTADYVPGLKLDPSLSSRAFRSPARQALEARGEAALVITLFPGEDTTSLQDWITSPRIGGVVALETAYAGGAVLHATVSRRHLDALSRREEVQYIEHAPELRNRDNIDASWIVQSNIPDQHPLHDAGLTGGGQIIGILDSIIGGLDLDHCAFRDDVDNTPGLLHRKVLAYNTNPGKLTHATHVAATVAGNREPTSMDPTRGLAYDAKIVYSRFPVFDEMAVYDALALHHGQGARVHTNSWGDDGEAWYTSLARGFDAFCYDFEASLVGVAISNGPPPAPPPPVQALRTPENAKNVLAVAASGYVGESPSENDVGSGAAGPTTDGRRKPEIFAPGFGTTSALVNTACSVTALTGTSMACPAVCGTAVLVREYFTDGYFPTGAPVQMDGFTPTAALVKAMLLNSAVDMTGVTGFPSNHEGWGRLLADSSVFLAGDARRLIVHDLWNATGLDTGEAAAHGLSVLSGSEPLKVTLVWTEPPASPGAFAVQVNDLDLEVVAPGGEVYRGNVFVNGQSAQGGERDDRNNVEQVLLSSPATGPWTVRVKGSAVNMGSQGYALVVTGDIQDEAQPLTVGVAPAPELNATGSPLPVLATVASGSDSLVADSVRLLVREQGDPDFTPIVMADMGGGDFQGFLPIVFCGQSIDYFVEAEGVMTGVITDPPEGPNAPFSASLGVDAVVFLDDFEGDMGWTSGAPEDTASTGAWERVDPNPTDATPDDDHTPVGTMAWVTQQAGFPGQTATISDVDGGFVSLTSPILDLSGHPEAQVSFWRWFYSSHSALLPQDTFRVDVSNDDGANWTNAMTWGGASGFQTLGGWVPHEFRLADVLAPTDQVRLRFRVEDVGGGSTVEGVVDDVVIVERQCVDAYCLGNANGDASVNFADITSVLTNWLETSAPGSGAPGDADHDGLVQFADITAVLQNWLEPCP